MYFIIFFFSSRRRHTRCGRDWSSDVCSSDLMLDDLRKGAIQHAEKVNREAALLLEQAGISHQSHVAVGDVVTEVVAAVKRLGCNTVVMGTRGMGSLGNLVMGSVATRVVHDVPVPVLLVK